jgi:F-type H+-transporting ATPase subunit c
MFSHQKGGWFMSKRIGLLTTLFVMGLTTAALAADPAGSIEKAEGLSFFVYSAIAAGLAIAIEGIARNPDSSGKVTVTMLIGLAMIESLAIYALVVSLILIYANPVSTMIQKFVGLVS